MVSGDGVDVPVVLQKQVPTRDAKQVPAIWEVLKEVEVPQVRFIDKFVDAPVVLQSQFP